MNRLDDLRRVRLEKLQKIRAMGVDPYPPRFDRTHLARQILSNAAALEGGKAVRVAGRMMSLREMGKAAFAHLQDGSGRIQIYLRRDDLPEGRFELLKLLDLGDFLGVEGEVFRTRTGEISVHARRLELLSKAIRPLPVVKEKDGVAHDSVSDPDLRYRQRHVDLILNPSVRRSLEMRTATIRALRACLDDREFLEVETPILQSLYGGAMARPFVTHHNALDIDLYLRIALELHLKRLLAGGLEKVYELSRVFRNEGMDRSHSPEFTMLEFYWAYADYTDAQELVEEIFREVAQRTVGGLELEFGGWRIDLAAPFRKASMRDLLLEHAGIDLVADDEARMRAWIRARGAEAPSLPGKDGCVEAVFDLAVVPQLIQPTFVLDYPRGLSPLTKAHREQPDRLVERFELFIGTHEYANAFSELNDPLDQRARFEEQARRRALGDEEAQLLDEEFLLALEHGLPPAAGVGIGVDRLVMLLAGETNIRDVLYFPHMKPEDGGRRSEVE